MHGQRLRVGTVANTSVSKVGGNLQIVQVSEEFELNCGGDIKVQLYFCRDPG